ncbi:hypothetical protein [Paenibacillus xylanilyticus]|uniref:Phospholipase C/D domain-containing protein n=1 Tax=Paenibacillus xylanilyticus TaxID=248903 RepID=A0A7Y6EZL2_9BACL|nr:hypothetical protein [Paenibacillus xylanilyticus]NUU79854.1 hypothetical protein [Paenibacillus xylanilyticus]
MPLPMVHLHVAVLFANACPEHVERGSFYLGNIAPDSIHMREGTTREDKEYTHFNPKGDENYVARLQEVYSTYMEQRSDEGWKWFVRGYFMHVLTDYFWFRSLYPEFVERVTRTDDNNGVKRTKDELGRLYYQETDQIDFNLYHHAGWSGDVWRLLKCTPSYDVVGRLTAEEILRWRDRTVSFFNEQANEPGIVPAYMTDDMVSSFVTDTVQRLIVLIHSWDPELQRLDVNLGS